MTPKPMTYRVLIIRPLMLHEQFTQELGAALQLKPELAEWAVKLIKMTMNATRSDIDNGASGRIMVDENFIPTGEPPPDPEGAYCLICKVRIWSTTTIPPTPRILPTMTMGSMSVAGVVVHNVPR